MSYNGSGTFNINTSGQPVVAGTVITATAFNLLTADLATGLTTAMTKDGQTTTTARIPFAQGISSTLVTDATNTTSGSIITAGGVGIAKALYVGTTANVAGAVTLGGIATFSAQPIFSSLTASSAVATDASKGLVSVTNTGTGNNVLATSPTITTPTISSLSSASATALTLQSAGTTAITVDTSQNVGIGTASPSRKLDVLGAAGTTVAKLSDGTNGSFQFNFASGQSAILDGGNQNLWVYDNSGQVSKFYTNNTERMRIDTSGNLLVGTTSQIGSGTICVQTSGNGVTAKTTGTTNNFTAFVGARNTNDGKVAEWYHNLAGSSVGNISVTSSATAYNTSSDYRLKNTITPMTGALSKVALLKPVTFKWNIDGSSSQGFIAHELQAVVPECVVGEKDGIETYIDEDGNEATRPAYQGIDTSFLVATLTAAIQELKAINDTQAETINALTARIVALENA